MTVAELLDRIGETSPTHHAMVLALQAIVHANAPGAEEAVKYGGLYYATTRPFGGIFTYAEHISLEFTRGVELDDPAGLLRGEGKHRRHLRFTTPNDIDAAVIGPYVAQAFERA